LIRTLAELDRYELAWERLGAISGNPVTDFAYARAWAAGLGGAQQLNIFVAGGAQPRAIAPLIINRSGAGWLTFLASEMYEILDFPCTDEGAVYELAHAVARTGRPLYLQRVPASSPVVAAVEAVYRGRGIVLRRPVGGSPWIPLDESWAEPERHLNSGRRSDLRRARRLAEKLGAVKTEIVDPEPARVPELMDEAFRVEAAGWKGARGTALATDPVRGPFFRRYAEHACRKRLLRLCFLRIGGQIAAVQIAVENGERFSLLRAGYDEDFARCSPGLLLTLESIRYATQRGLRSYEFNGSIEPWTEIWTRHERPCYAIRVYPFRPRGIRALLADGWHAAARRLRRGEELS
jgi:CelD/BcsL family acetyltransferase involved in cellulose biosynthesis